MSQTRWVLTYNYVATPTITRTEYFNYESDAWLRWQELQNPAEIHSTLLQEITTLAHWGEHDE